MLTFEEYFKICFQEFVFINIQERKQKTLNAGNRFRRSTGWEGLIAYKLSKLDKHSLGIFAALTIYTYGRESHWCIFIQFLLLSQI